MPSPARKHSLAAAVAAFVAAPVLMSQTTIREFDATLSLPFGSTAGRMIAAGVQLVFVDPANQNSVVVPRTNLSDLTNSGSTLTAQLQAPIRDALGERTRLTFQLPDERAAAAVVEWYRQKPAAAAQTISGSAATEQSYPANHKKLFGGSRGRLIVNATGISYESIDDVNDSRRWLDKDIKELKQESPYELELVPFAGDRYTFGLEGQGMGAGEYEQLVNRITSSRSR